MSKVKKLINSSRDRDGSLDGTLSHGVISTGDALEQVSVIFKPQIGFFAESSTRYIPSSLVGDISVRLTLAPNAVLTYKEVTVDMPGNFTDAAARTAAMAARAPPRRDRSTATGGWRWWCSTTAARQCRGCGSSSP